jgi:hypothetical protein
MLLMELHLLLGKLSNGTGLESLSSSKMVQDGISKKPDIVMITII